MGLKERCDVMVSIIATRYGGNRGRAFSVSGRWGASNLIFPENEMHIMRLFSSVLIFGISTPEFSLSPS